MIPLRDVIPSRTTPYITVTIILLNAAAWFYELAMPREELNVFLQLFGVVPAAFVPTTLLTSMFLHAGWMHLGGNMLFLWIFGNNVEDLAAVAEKLDKYPNMYVDIDARISELGLRSDERGRRRDGCEPSHDRHGRRGGARIPLEGSGDCRARQRRTDRFQLARDATKLREQRRILRAQPDREPEVSFGERVARREGERSGMGGDRRDGPSRPAGGCKSRKRASRDGRRPGPRLVHRGAAVAGPRGPHWRREYLRVALAGAPRGAGRHGPRARR